MARKTAPAKTAYVPSMSDESVMRSTGKKWAAWFALLDGGGAAGMSHKEIAADLHKRHGLSPWWSQMVTVEYERARGRREVHQKPSGFEVNVSRTIAVPRETAWQAFAETKHLSKWFTSKAKQSFRVGGRYSNGDGDGGVFLAIIAPRRLRFTWEQAKHAPGSVVEVTIAEKNDGRCVVQLTHSRLASKVEVADLKQGWSWAMDSLKAYLETGTPVTFEDWSAQTAKGKTKARGAKA